MRSLILAGGGMKVAYQAGCLQVLLSEAKLDFDHVDAASGGCFNAALWASGRSGAEIADLWRTTDPRDFITPDVAQYVKWLWLRSVGTSAGVRRVLGDVWKLDYQTIRACTRPVFTFNHFDFSTKRLRVVENRDLDEDLLVASVTLLGWTPPVGYGGRTLFDAVWCTDGNVAEAIRRGADEIWAIWTVSDRPTVRDGVIAEYFALIETVADAKFREEWREIELVNAGIAEYGPNTSRGETDLRLAPGVPGDRPPYPPPGRRYVHRHLIRQEVGMHYVLNLSRDRAAAAVALGVEDARAYMRHVGLLPATPLYPSAAPASPEPGFSFAETMRGFFMPGMDDPVAGERAGRRAGNALTLRLAIAAADFDAFLHHPAHEAAVSGTVDAPLLAGAPMAIECGTFAPFVDDRDAAGVVIPGRKRMRYRLRFRDPGGTAYELDGEKIVSDAPGHAVWPDTTTLFVRLERHADGGVVQAGAGIARVHVLDLLATLGSFGVGRDESRADWAKTVARYAAFFLGRTWDVYARGILDYAPF